MTVCSCSDPLFLLSGIRLEDIFSGDYRCIHAHSQIHNHCVLHCTDKSEIWTMLPKHHLRVESIYVKSLFIWDFWQTFQQRFLMAVGTTFKDVFGYGKPYTYTIRCTHVFRARRCTHCISRTYLLCSVLPQLRNLRNSYAHFATETEKEKTDRMKRKRDTEGRNTEKAFNESVISVCSSSFLLLCAYI